MDKILDFQIDGNNCFCLTTNHFSGKYWVHDSCLFKLDHEAPKLQDRKIMICHLSSISCYQGFLYSALTIGRTICLWHSSCNRHGRFREFDFLATPNNMVNLALQIIPKTNKYA